MNTVLLAGVAYEFCCNPFCLHAETSQHLVAILWPSPCLPAAHCFARLSVGLLAAVAFVPKLSANHCQGGCFPGSDLS